MCLCVPQAICEQSLAIDVVGDARSVWAVRVHVVHCIEDIVEPEVRVKRAVVAGRTHPRSDLNVCVSGECVGVFLCLCAHMCGGMYANVRAVHVVFMRVIII